VLQCSLLINQNTMKRFLAFSLLSALLLSACAPSYTVATPEELKENPDLKGVIKSWQKITDAAEAQNCEAFITQMRKEMFVKEEECPLAFEWLADENPVIDWTKSEWNGDMGKVKISREGGGGVTAFILDTTTDVWGADTRFWE
jgi:hypothetical protein